VGPDSAAHLGPDLDESLRRQSSQRVEDRSAADVQFCGEVVDHQALATDVVAVEQSILDQLVALVAGA
jgi:hypothetical protein